MTQSQSQTDVSARQRWPRFEWPVSWFVPFSRHVTPTIISTKNGEYVSTWRLGGRTFEGVSEAEKFGWLEELNNTIKGFPIGFGLWTHLVRRKVLDYPVSEYPDAFSRQHDIAYRSTFEGKPPMVNDLYLSVIARASVDPALRLLSRFERRTGKRVEAWQNQAISQVEEMARKLQGALRRYDPEPLGIVVRNGVRFSEQARFYGQLLNGGDSAVPLVNARLCDFLPISRPFFSRHGEQAELRAHAWKRRFVMVEIREYCAETKPGHLAELMDLPFEFVLSQSFGSMSKSDGDKALARQIQWLSDSGDASKTQIQELSQARDDLASGKFIMGDHHAVITVFGEDAEETLLNASTAIGKLAESGIIGRIVDRALIPAFYSQLPGNWRRRPRPAPITSTNFLCFNSLHNYLFGKPSGNPWGPAVTMLKTKAGTPYFMNFHVSLPDVDEEGKRLLGNFTMIGQSGTGKTVAFGHFLTQARKLRMTGVLFDKDRGLQVTVMAMGGTYLPFQMGRPTGWNFLQMEPTAKNLAMMRRLLGMLATDGDISPSLREQRDIATAVSRLVQFIELKDRRLSVLLQFLPAAASKNATLSLREKLLRWCEGNENGWVFDNPRDDLDLSKSDLFGFDLTEFLEHGAIRDVAQTYLLYRTSNMADGRRIAYLFDEVQHALAVPYFRRFLQDGSRTIRKKNGVFGFATQEPAALLQYPEGRSMVQQSATLVLFPNPKATYEEYVDGFKLPPAVFNLVKELGEFSRQFVVKQNDSTVTAELDLSKCQDSLLVFSGSPDMAELAEAAVAERGNDPQQWLPLYLERARKAGRS